jgi:hypothetical protein
VFEWLWKAVFPVKCLERLVWCGGTMVVLRRKLMMVQLAVAMTTFGLLKGWTPQMIALHVAQNHIVRREYQACFLIESQENIVMTLMLPDCIKPDLKRLQES